MKVYCKGVKKDRVAKRGKRREHENAGHATVVPSVSLLFSSISGETPLLLCLAAPLLAPLPRLFPLPSFAKKTNHVVRLRQRSRRRRSSRHPRPREDVPGHSAGQCLNPSHDAALQSFKGNGKDTMEGKAMAQAKEIVMDVDNQDI